MGIFVAKIQKINLIGCHLLLKSVNFFIFHFQNLNFEAARKPSFYGVLRGTTHRKPENP
jgi:hypothetical protein